MKITKRNGKIYISGRCGGCERDTSRQAALDGNHEHIKTIKDARDILAAQMGQHLCKSCVLSSACSGPVLA